MHGREVCEGRRANRRHTREKGCGRDESVDWRESWSEPEAGKEDMGEVFEVSRSGYYAWRKRQERAAKDQWLADLIMECQKKCKQT